MKGCLKNLRNALILSFSFFVFSLAQNPSLLSAEEVVTLPTVTVEADAPTECSWNDGPDKGTYCLLAPLGDLVGKDGKVAILEGEGGMSGYLDGLFRAGIMVATGLALVMIVIGGLQYVTTDAWGGKSAGRERISQALIGLLLALGTVVIVSQLNPLLLRNDLALDAEITLTSIDAPDTDLVFIPDSGVLKSSENLKDPSSVGITGNPNHAAAQRIVESARKNLNTSTCMPATEYGRRGCGYAFGLIMKDAGIDIGLSASEVLGTRAIYNALANSNKFYLVPGGLYASQPGDVVISPTTDKATGHVGIVDGLAASSIISNSSASGTIKSNYSASTWSSYYGGKGLQTYVFRVKL